jgi:N-methylhydantoinase A
VIGGARLAELVGESAALTFDMGGTTADIGLVIDGSPQRRFSGEAAGMPINLPQIDVLCIGSGGGSIARVDQFGSLTVGPASAGAEPGPAAYGLGGEDATVTDAHVVLGNLSAESALADGVPLDRELAERAVTAAVGEPLGLGVEEAAVAILRIANANMANALRVMTIARGHDPRRFALVAIGGAGPMHACALADELGIPRVVIPRYPGVAAALGLLATDIRHDLRRSWLQPTAAITPADLDLEFARLEAEAEDLLETSASVTRSFEFSHELDMRYRGQAYNLTVPFAPRPVTAEAIAAAVKAFEDEHRRLYDYTPTVTETDIVTLRLRALARIPTSTGRSPRTAGGPRSPAPGASTMAAGASGRPPDASSSPRTIRSPPNDHRAGGHDRGDPTGWSGLVGAAGTLVLQRRGGLMSPRHDRSDHHGDPGQRVPPHRRGDGGGRVPRLVLADHPRDARLQLRSVHARRAHGRQLRADPGPARPDAVRAGGGSREVGRGRRRATPSSRTTPTWAAPTRPTCRCSRRFTATAASSPGPARSPTTSTSAAGSRAPRAPSAPSCFQEGLIFRP